MLVYYRIKPYFKIKSLIAFVLISFVKEFFFFIIQVISVTTQTKFTVLHKIKLNIRKKTKKILKLERLRIKNTKYKNI